MIPFFVCRALYRPNSSSSFSRHILAKQSLTKQTNRQAASVGVGLFVCPWHFVTVFWQSMHITDRPVLWLIKRHVSFLPPCPDRSLRKGSLCSFFKKQCCEGSLLTIAVQAGKLTRNEKCSLFVLIRFLLCLSLILSALISPFCTTEACAPSSD